MDEDRLKPNIREVEPAVDGQARDASGDPGRRPEGVALRCRTDPELPNCATDAGRVEQILVNLFGNAIKYAPERSAVRVGITARTRASSTRSRMTAPACRRSDVERIFDIYVTKAGEESRGLGLGLPLSRRLARLLGGELHAVSRPGQGGCFILEVPARHPEEIFTLDCDHRSRACARDCVAMKILVVEDDLKVAGFIEHGLKEEGYLVDVAHDGDEATMLAHVNEYDVILLDVVLPKKSGFQIASRAPTRGPEHAHPHADVA